MKVSEFKEKFKGLNKNKGKIKLTSNTRTKNRISSILPTKSDEFNKTEYNYIIKLNDFDFRWTVESLRIVNAPFNIKFEKDYLDYDPILFKKYIDKFAIEDQAQAMIDIFKILVKHDVDLSREILKDMQSMQLTKDSNW